MADPAERERAGLFVLKIIPRPGRKMPAFLFELMRGPAGLVLAVGLYQAT
jgi:hypothetical protein